MRCFSLFCGVYPFGVLVVDVEVREVDCCVGQAARGRRIADWVYVDYFCRCRRSESLGEFPRNDEFVVFFRVLGNFAVYVQNGFGVCLCIGITKRFAEVFSECVFIGYYGDTLVGRPVGCKCYVVDVF